MDQGVQNPLFGISSRPEILAKEDTKLQASFTSFEKKRNGVLNQVSFLSECM